MSAPATDNALLKLADACQQAADEIDARLVDFSHPLNAAFRDQLNAQEGKLRVSAQALRSQELGQLAAAGTSERTKLDAAAQAALTAVGRISSVANATALIGAVLGVAGAIATAVATGNPAGIVPAATTLIDVANSLAGPAC